MRLCLTALVCAVVPALLVAGCGSSTRTATAVPSATGTKAAGPTNHELILATTTSTQDSGLLDVLIPLYQRQTGDHVKGIAGGSGAAMGLGRQGNADVLLVHSPAAEEQFVKDGAGIERTRVMYNDFVIVGPPSDPARIRGLNEAVEAFRRIAGAKASFYGRGDNSGTQAEELTLWAAAGLAVPRGQPWYHETGQGMGPTLTIAVEKDGYTLTDRATWLANADHARQPLLVEGDDRLFNVYHVIVVNPDRHLINREGAERFRAFMIAQDTLQVIATFGKDKYGQALFAPYTE